MTGGPGRLYVGTLDMHGRWDPGEDEEERRKVKKESSIQWKEPSNVFGSCGSYPPTYQS